MMQIKQLHDWCLSIDHAKIIQQQLSGQVVCHDITVNQPRYIAGADIWTSRNASLARAAIVVLEYPELSLLDIAIEERKLNFPYIPGYLSFREAPLILAAYTKLSIYPDLLIVDGQGIAHPRRLGLASHLGLHLDIPTIGCAKSRLCGHHEPVPDQAGSFSYLFDDNEIIGAVLRTKATVKPLYISVGHNICLETSLDRIMQCCRGYRLPEPSRMAHITAGKQPVT